MPIMPLRFELLTACLLLGPAFSVASKIPAQAQAIDQRNFNVLNNTLPPAEFNASSVRDFTKLPPSCIASLLTWASL